MLIKIVVLLILLAIVISLFSALFFMFRKKDANDSRMVKALTVRIGLSVGLFIVLVTLMFTGVIKPVGIPAQQNSSQQK